MRKSAVVTAAAVTVAALGTLVILDVGFRDTESTTGINERSSVVVDGTPQLLGNIVAGRTESKFHPLPWIGSEISNVDCAQNLPAQAGATITCTGIVDGKKIDIPVTVASATADSVTWSFTR